MLIHMLRLFSPVQVNLTPFLYTNPKYFSIPQVLCICLNYLIAYVVVIDVASCYDCVSYVY